MYKVMTIVGTRPEIIKMSCVISNFDKFTNHILVHTGQNFDYELNEIFFEDLGIRKPDHFLEAVGNSTAKTIALIIEKADRILELEKPDALMLYGDTNSCLSVIAAKRRKIPIFHMEAGNRCFDQRVPEELNRKILDHLSDLNFVLTEHARQYLVLEGISPKNIIKTGSHMREVLNTHKQKIQNSKILDKLSLIKDNYFLISAHREENVDSLDNLKDLMETLNAIAEKYRKPVIVSTHPRTMNQLERIKNNKINDNIKFMKPFGFCDYIKLQLSAFCILSDSGTITEETDILKLKAVMIRNSHERPEGMDAGTLIMSGLKKQNVLNAIDIVTSIALPIKNIEQVEDYKSNLVSKKILNAVISYIDYINRTVWYK
jgi:UDP-N-acetylglucosamine 2-epimerase